MLSTAFPLVVAALSVHAAAPPTNHTAPLSLPRCRSQPGDALFPTAAQLARFNASVGGRLVAVAPSGRFCAARAGGCPDALWADTIFRSDIPGAMDEANWEQDYAADPPSLCFRNTTVCGQGNVPLYAVNATHAAHIQAGVRFARAHNLRVALKASGHDYLGRSTAKSAFLLWTRYMEDIAFHDDFRVGGKNAGAAVTVGSGVGLAVLYRAARARGRIFVGGLAQNVVPAGGYVQGGGHSPLSPKFGLAADNVLDFRVVVASGRLLAVNEVSHPDLFWALRGGGAGSWGVLVAATFRTFPTLAVATHRAVIAVADGAAAAALAAAHARHVFDWDAARAAQYFYLVPAARGGAHERVSPTFFPGASAGAARAAMAPFMAARAAARLPVRRLAVDVRVANDVFSAPTAADAMGGNEVLGSRLVPAAAYRGNATGVGATYRRLLEGGPGPVRIGGHMVAGGQVAANRHIDSAVHPQWRTAKTHVVVLSSWAGDTPPADVERIRAEHTSTRVALLAGLAGAGAGSYSNEGDVREADFRATFFGAHYARLRRVKAAYDPEAMFVVAAGVGSEEWDAYGLCRVPRRAGYEGQWGVHD